VPSTFALVHLNLERRLEHLRALGYSMRRLSLAVGRRAAWLSQLMDPTSRPGGWTLDMVDKVAAAVGENPLVLFSVDYDPTAAPPPRAAPTWNPVA
jgi:hypothetical protein